MRKLPFLINLSMEKNKHFNTNFDSMFIKPLQNEINNINNYILD